jgi:hypothetical protein
MKIELRKMKSAPSMSQETNAFTAEVWVDGVRRGTARNDGHGGPNHVEPASLALEIEAHARTLPPVKVPWGRGELEMCGDLLLGRMVQRALEGKRLERMLKTKTVLLKGGKCYTVKGHAVPVRPGEEHLNGLPFEDALTKYLAAVGAA